MERPRLKLHICRTCDRSFARLEHSKRHAMSHTKEKPFSCPDCARCFARRDLLLCHQRKLHETIATSLTPRREQHATITGSTLNGAGPPRAAETTWKSTVSSSTGEAPHSNRGANGSRGNDQPQMGHVGGTNPSAFNELLRSRDTLSVVDCVSYPDHSPLIGLDEACMFDDGIMSTNVAMEWRSYSQPAFAAPAWHGWSGLQAASVRGLGYNQLEQEKAFAPSSSTATTDQTHCLEANFVANGAFWKPPVSIYRLHVPAVNPSDVDVRGSAKLQNSTGFYSTNEATADGSWSPTVGAICQSRFRNRIRDGSGNLTLAAMRQNLSRSSFDDTYSLCL